MPRSPHPRSPQMLNKKNKHEVYEALEAKRDAQKYDRRRLLILLSYLKRLKRESEDDGYPDFFNGISYGEFKTEFPLLNEYDKEQRHLVKKKENLELSINKIDRKFNDLRRWMYTDIHDNISRIEDMLEKTKSRSRSRSKSRSRSRSRSRSG